MHKKLHKLLFCIKEVIWNAYMFRAKWQFSNESYTNF